MTTMTALDLPPIFLLPTNLPTDELHRLEDSIPSLTYDINEAHVVLGRISKRERAMFELRRAKLDTVPLDVAPATTPPESDADADADAEGPSPKRRKLSGSASTGLGIDPSRQQLESTVKVLKLAWLTDSMDQGKVLPMDDYFLYEGRKMEPRPLPRPLPQPKTRSKPKSLVRQASSSAIIIRAAADQPRDPMHRVHPGRHPAYASGHAKSSQPPPLLHQTTSEHDVSLPELPAFLHTTYSCQRPTPVNPPNAAFVEELKKIRTMRLLQGDQIGVRAYSTSIATLAAYPYPLLGPLDVSRLPGCGTKIAVLYQQWLEIGHLKEVSNAAEDQQLAVLQVFYNIWGVGDTTAREFYRKGWRDLDDLVEYGWDTLSRVQQIGVKFYDEFLLGIPRDEVEAIGSVILEHARKVDAGFEMVIVGGYRRGKRESGDVDVVLSHRNEAQTLNFVRKVVSSLEKDRFITHTLSLSERSSDRGQQPLPWKGEGRNSGSGFDTLDKALVVWQDSGRAGAAAPHRRVDIIITAWKTAGCAVMGWSGGTTFQRDLRRYCKRERALKFDSSGVRSRVDGEWVDLESELGSGGERMPAPDMETAERRVFAGLGLAWRPPEERCTG